MGSFPIISVMHYQAFIGVVSSLEAPSPRPQRISPFAHLMRRLSVTRRLNRGRAIAQHRARVMAG